MLAKATSTLALKTRVPQTCGSWVRSTAGVLYRYCARGPKTLQSRQRQYYGLFPLSRADHNDPTALSYNRAKLVSYFRSPALPPTTDAYAAAPRNRGDQILRAQGRKTIPRPGRQETRVVVPARRAACSGGETCRAGCLQWRRS